MAKVGDKYIIEIEEVIRRNGAPQIARVKGFNALVFDKNGLEKLEPYENARREVYLEGYTAGYGDGKSVMNESEHITSKDISDAYNKGLNDAWEVGRKIIELAVNGEYSPDVLRKIFGEPLIQLIFKHNTASEAIAKIKEYEEKQKQDAEIKVGDEVYSDAFDNKGIVTHITADKVACVCIICNGSTMMKVGLCGLRKTGRHFPQIIEVLEQMKGEADGK